MVFYSVVDLMEVKDLKNRQGRSHTDIQGGEFQAEVTVPDPRTAE